MRYTLWIILFLFCSCSTPQKEKVQSSKFATIGSVERLDPMLDSFFGEDVEIEVLASGFEWTEGPLWLKGEDALIFSDVPTNKIWKWTEKDSISLYLEPSGYLGDRTGKKEPGSNGLTLNDAGDLILSQHGERQIGKMLAPIDAPKSEFQPLATNFDGKRFNSPNDLVFNSKGQLFFTDPPYGLDPWDEKELEIHGVYRLDAEGKVTLLLDTLSRPNGVALSPDEKTLYVAQSDPEKARYYEFSLNEDGDVVSGSVLLDVTSLQSSSKKGLPDGLKVHSSGVLFASGPGGILVISPEGKHLGTILTENGTANCAFDAGEKYLYMTADAYLMRIKLK
jgi:gluconolactonase